MAQKSMFWDGAAGDGGSYSQSDMMDTFFRAILNGTGNRGVLPGHLNELVVTGTSSPLSVNTGAAILYGMFYENDAAVTVNIPTPSSGTSRYDRVVVRRDWSTQTARIGRVIGTEAAAPAVPALTQAAGAIYEVPLATVLVNDAGNVTVTDTREECQWTTTWPANAVDTEHYVAGAVTPDKVPDRTRYDLKGAGQIEPDSANPCTWAAGASYDYWSFADAATNSGWVFFIGPTGVVSNQVDIYIWTVPDVNGAGGGAELAQWDYNTYSGPSGAVLNNTNGTISPDQQARVNTTVYADQLIAAFAINEGDILIIKLDRDGAADSYNSAMRLLGIEMRWTADA